MLTLTSAQRAALASRQLMRRMFVWFDVLDGGEPAAAGFWSDVGRITTGGRTYTGSGNLIAVSPLVFAGDLSIQGLLITLSGVSAEAVNLVRGLTVKQRPVEVSIGLFDPATGEIVDALIPYFTGKIDKVEIKTPEAGGDSTIKVTCESVSRALTIARTDTRSDACHKRLFPADDGFKYAGIQRDKPVYFGVIDPKKAAKREKRRKQR